MQYATQQDLVDRFGAEELTQLTDRAGVGAIDAAVVSQALADASAEIDGYIAAVLPLADPPRVLVSLACDIARYRLYDQAATEQVAKRYDDAVKFLKGIAAGDIDMGLAANDTPVTTGGPEFSASDRVFTNDTLADF